MFICRAYVLAKNNINTPDKIQKKSISHEHNIDRRTEYFTSLTYPSYVFNFPHNT